MGQPYLAPPPVLVGTVGSRMPADALHLPNMACLIHSGLCMSLYSLSCPTPCFSVLMWVLQAGPACLFPAPVPVSIGEFHGYA